MICLSYKANQLNCVLVVVCRVSIGVTNRTHDNIHVNINHNNAYYKQNNWDNTQALIHPYASDSVQDMCPCSYHLILAM